MSDFPSINHLGIADLAVAFDALSAAMGTLGSFVNQPRCGEGASNLIDCICDRNEDLLADIARRLEQSHPSNDFERMARFRSLMSWASQSIDDPAAALVYLVPFALVPAAEAV